MSRNPNKTPCQHPTCRNWAMRGQTLCRIHRDLELGPTGGGAPPGNLNAVKTGDHAQPLDPRSLDVLARLLVDDPDHLPGYLADVIGVIHARTGDPYKTLVALRPVISRLSDLVARRRLIHEVRAALQQLPPSEQSPFLSALHDATVPGAARSNR